MLRVALALSLITSAALLIACPGDGAGAGEGEGEGEGEEGEGEEGEGEEGEGEEGEGEEGEGEEGEGEGEGEGGCLAGGTVVVDDGGAGQCNDPKAIVIPAAGVFVVQTGTDATNGNNNNLNACSADETLRDVVFEVSLPAGTTSVTASVDAAGGSPIVNIHAGPGCGETVDIDQCSVLVGECAAADAVAGTDFAGDTIFISVSEDAATATDYALRLDVVQ